MDMLHDRATRDTVAAWVQAVTPALPAVAREDPYWTALVDAASTIDCRNQRAWQRSADWLFTAVIPALLRTAPGDPGLWASFAERRDFGSGRRLLAELDQAVDAAHRAADAAAEAVWCSGAPEALAQEERAHAEWQRAVLQRRAVSIATLDRTFGGIGHAAAAAIFASDDPQLVSELDPIGLLAAMLDDSCLPSPFELHR